MNPRKIKQLILLNAAIILLDVALFSDALFGLSLFSGAPLMLSLAWTVLAGSVFAFFKGNSMILNNKETRYLLKELNSLGDCVPALKEALQKGDIFDECILKNLGQIERFRRKSDTINDILTQKFSTDELTFQHFSAVLRDVEGVVYTNIRSILNKISAFDIEDYENIMRKDVQYSQSRISQDKMAIYNEYITFVNNSTDANEDILLKLDKMLLEISRYNSLEDGDVQKLPAIIEMDKLIKNAKLYK